MNNRKPFLAVAFFAVAAVAVNDTAFAHTVTMGNIEIIHAWAEPSSGDTALAHPTVSNEGTEAIALLGVETPVAADVRLMQEGQDVERITIQAEDIITFDGAPYTMELASLTTPLVDGGHFPVTFYFTGDVVIDMHMVIGESTEMQMAEGSMVRSTMPSDGTTLAGSPRELRITFAHPVRLTVLQISTLFGEVIPVEADQAAAATEEVAVPLPTLAPDDYTIEWRAEGHDDHVMAGSFSFSISDDAGAADTHHGDGPRDDMHHGNEHHGNQGHDH